MVLEYLINPKKAAGKKWEVFLIGFVYSFVAVFLSLWIFKSYTSIMMILLVTIAVVPFVSFIFRSEEKKDLVIRSEIGLLKEHGKAISMFILLFLGFVAAFLVLYLIMPAGMLDNVFKAQTETISAVQGGMTGQFVNSFNAVTSIFFNNAKILFFCIAFSFFYGAGAIFILVWNASVMATAIGSFVRSSIISASGLVGYLHLTSLGLVKYMLHGIPEIFAYFIAGLASGMISFAFIRHDYKDKHFKHMLKDAFDLIIISVAILIFAALIEVYVTPLVV